MRTQVPSQRAGREGCPRRLSCVSLYTLAGPGSPGDPGDLIAPTFVAAFDGWVDAGSAATSALEHLLDDGAPPVMLIGLIASTYRKMALAHALLSKGAPPKEIFRQVPMPPFKQSSYLQILNRVDGRRVAQQMVRIAEADLGIKTSKATPRMQVELLVNELMN